MHRISRPIKSELPSPLRASTIGLVLSRLALLVAYAHYNIFRKFVHKITLIH